MCYGTNSNKQNKDYCKEDKIGEINGEFDELFGKCHKLTTPFFYSQ